MKRILAILSLALLLSFALTAQITAEKYGPPSVVKENRLSFSAEFSVPGASARQLFLWAHEWSEDIGPRYSGGICMGAGDSHPSQNLWVFKVFMPTLKEKQHKLFANLYVKCEDGRYILDFTDIIGQVHDGSIMKMDYWYMTKDMTGIKDGLYHSYYVRHFKRIRQYIEDTLFPELCSSIYSVMTAYAEMELPLKKEFSAEFEVPGVSCEQLVHLARFYVDTELWRGLSCSYLSHEKVQETVQFRLDKLPLAAGYVTNAKLSIECYNGRYTVKMTDIEPKCKEVDSWKAYPSRRYYAETLSEMESSVFPTICKIVHDVMTSSK